MLKLGTQGITALRLGDQEIKKAYLGDALVFGAEAAPSRLPEGYTEVEYIQTIDLSYFLTGIKPQAELRIVMDVEPIKDGTAYGTQKRYLFYSYAKSPTLYYYCTVFWNQSGVSAQMGLYGGTTYSTVIDNNKAARRMLVEFDYPSKTVSVNEKSASMPSNGVYSSMPEIKLMSSGTAAYSLNGKFYSCKMYLNDDSIRDFVPCIDPSGAVGLYDLVDGKFYGNSGTGTLEAGPAV